MPAGTEVCTHTAPSLSRPKTLHRAPLSFTGRELKPLAGSNLANRSPALSRSAPSLSGTRTRAAWSLRAAPEKGNSSCWPARIECSRLPEMNQTRPLSSIVRQRMGELILCAPAGLRQASGA